MENETGKVSFLGQFQMVYHGIALTEDDIHSEMITKLLAYMLLHRKRAMTIRELADMLWGGGGSDNPVGALKNLMYRLRGVLKQTYGGEEQFVLTNLGSYCWNNEIEMSLDVEEFETQIKEAKASADSDKRIAHFETAIALYRGRFLDKQSSELWVVPLTAYYQSLFLTGVKSLADCYEKGKKYEEMEALCTRALEYDNFDEEIHCLVLRALISQQKQSMALSHYENTVTLFYENLGIRNLTKLNEIYEQILLMKKVSGTAQVQEIYQDVQENEMPDGAYICGYAVFREIYRIDARRVNSVGISEHVLLLTLSLRKGVSVTENVERYLLNRVMDRTEKILRSSLRIGDVATRYSDSQFLVLLPACTYEAGKRIAQRIIYQLERNEKNKRYTVDYEIEELNLAEEAMINRGEKMAKAQ